MKDKNMINSGMMVAIVGRANVGKSSIFNRLTGERKAVVCDEPGTTRDRVIGEVFWQDKSFWLMDTAGLLKTFSDRELKQSIEMQIENVIKEADLVLWVIDGQVGLLDEDWVVWQKLKRQQKKIILVVNKIDSLKKKNQAVSDRKIFLKENFFVSAKTGYGMGDLLDFLAAKAKDKDFFKIDPRDVAARLCIVGRPNVGKSTLTNSLCGYERMTVAERAGTTRDVGEVVMDFNDKKILLLDTAGLRAKGRASRVAIEKYSVLRAVRAMESAEVVVIVLDMVEGLTHQDMVILSMAQEMNKGLIIFANKWDLGQESQEEKDKFIDKLRWKLGWMWWVPVVFGSAKRKINLDILLEQVLKVKENYSAWFEDGALDELVKEMLESNNRFKVLGLTEIRQNRTNPPEFTVGLKKINKVRCEEEKMFKNYIREGFELYGVAIQLKFRED